MTRPPSSSPSAAAARASALATKRLLTLFLNARDLGRFSSSTFARIAVIELTRAGHEAAFLPATKRQEFVAIVETLSSSLHMPPDRNALQAFASACVDTAAAMRPPPRHPGARLSHVNLPSSRQSLIESAIYAEVASAKDDADIVRRAVTRALKEGRRARRGTVATNLDDHDPRRELLGLPDMGQTRLLRTEVRAHLARASGTLGATLHDASAFAPAAMRDVLGEELFALCRPLGFGDARRTKILIGVSSSSLAQEVSMRKTELIARLRTVPGFEAIRDLRFHVEASDILPAVTATRRNPPSR